MRLEFDDINDWTSWVQDFVSKDRHVAFATKSREIIIVPLRSTQPLTLAWMRFASGEFDGALKVIETKEVKMYILKSFAWRIDREPAERFRF